MTTIFWVITLILLSVMYSILIYWILEDNRKERQDLYNRLMAKSLPEYQAATTEDNHKVIKNQILANARKQDDKRRGREG
jgi:hypothetical protein